MHLLASFEWSVIWQYHHALLEGLKRTIEVSLLGIAVATAIGLVLGAIRAHRIPVLTQFTGFTTAWLAVGLWGGAFNTENYRAGFEAVPWRYREAGLALGFGKLATFFRVTLPIGGRIALPSTINTYVSVLKNTTLLTAIGYQELTTTSRSISSETFRDVEMLATIAVVYLLLVWTLSFFVRLLERRLAYTGVT